VRDYVQTVLDFIQLYQKHYPEPIPEIQVKAEAEDLKFLQDDLLKILASIEMGSDRIREIAKTLRNFSRTDEAEFQTVDIHEGIESTLIILQHRIKAQTNRPMIEIIKDYSNLPLVECYPGSLNQVFMNILANAIDALDDLFHKAGKKIDPLLITIRTCLIGDSYVKISMIDNAGGIPEDIQKNIFQPFFTTKSVNKGTGMGLSISYQLIVEKHRGKLECLSIPGIGTEFVIQIPLRQNSRS
jgi:signal transduction histidine kinase